jgi:hypothetical protein
LALQIADSAHVHINVQRYADAFPASTRSP